MIYSATSIFLNKDIKNQLTGIEHAALLRATLFENKTGVPPIVATLDFNPFAEYYAQKHKSTGRHSNQLNIVNIWDVLLNLEEYDDGPEGNNEYINFDTQNNLNEESLIIKKEFFEDTEIIRQIDFYNAEIKLKSQIFHLLGHICCEKQYDNAGTHTQSIYFASNGRPLFLEITADFKSALNLQTGFYFFIKNNANPHEQQIKYIGGINHLRALALLRLIRKQENQNIVLVIDKNIVAYNAAIMARDQLLKEGKRIYVISHFHSTHYRSFNKNGTIKKHYKDVLEYKKKSADHIVCLTTKQQAEIQTRFPKQSIHCIPHTFNKNLIFKENKTQADEIQPNIVYVARLSPEKNHIEAIQIFDKVLKQVPNARLHIYGTGSKRKEIIAKINEQDLGDSVFLKGHTDSIDKVYQSACLSISTSKMEGFGLSVLESFACGCPCVAYDVNYGPSDIIDSGINGFLIKPGAQEEFANKVISLLNDRELRNQFGKQARQSAVNKFSEDVVFSLWAKLYKTLTPNLPIKINGKDSLLAKRLKATQDLHSYHKEIQEKYNPLQVKTWIFSDNIAVIDFERDNLQVAIDNIIGQQNVIIKIFGRNDLSRKALTNAASTLSLPVADDKNKHTVLKQPLTDSSMENMRQTSKVWFEKLHQWLRHQ